MVRTTLLFLLLGVVGCSVSPQPLPPPEELGLSADAIRIEAASPGVLRVTGEPGAATGDADAVEVTNLGNASSNFLGATAGVTSDGSFALEIPGELADSIRLQAFAGPERTAPLDAVAAPDGTLQEPTRIECVALSPAASEIDVGSVPVLSEGQGPITITNNCPDAITIDELILRDGLAWEWQLASSDVLEAGVSASIVARFVPSTTGPSTDVLRIRLSNGIEADYRAVTLRGTGQ